MYVSFKSQNLTLGRTRKERGGRLRGVVAHSQGFSQLLSGIKEKLPDKMMQSNYLCVVYLLSAKNY